MRNINWLRYGLAFTALAVGGFGAVLAACGDDDSGVTATDGGGGTDGNNNNNDSGNNNTDSGNTDSGKDGSTTPTPAKIIAVHAATDYGPNHPTGVIRVCYATKTASDTSFTVSPLAPLPHTVENGSAAPFPGIPIGTGGPFPSTGLPLEGIAIKPYLLNAKALYDRGVVGTTGLAATARCNNLLKSDFNADGGFDGGAGPLEVNKDYWELPEIPAGTFKNNKTYILAIYGCTSDTDGTAITAYGGKCGPDLAGTGPYAPTGTAGPGNLKIVVLEIDGTATAAADEIGIQAAHLSPQYQAYKSNNQIAPYKPVIINGDDAGPDAGDDAGFHFVSQTELQFSTTAITPVVKVKGFVSNKGYFANNTQSIALGAPEVAIPMNNTVGKQPSIQYIVEGKTVPNTAELYVNGKAYTFVLVGDPAPPSAAVAISPTRKVHYLGFPNQFTPPPAN